MAEGNKCRDCVHVAWGVAHGGSIVRCGRGWWDPKGQPEGRFHITQWYAVNTLRKNRLPISEYGRLCPDFTP